MSLRAVYHCHQSGMVLLYACALALDYPAAPQKNAAHLLLAINFGMLESERERAARVNRNRPSTLTAHTRDHLASLPSCSSVRSSMLPTTVASTPSSSPRSCTWSDCGSCGPIRSFHAPSRRRCRLLLGRSDLWCLLTTSACFAMSVGVITSAYCQDVICSSV